MARDSAERAEIDETPRVDRPETRYAKSGGVNVAYQVVGDGPFDLVFVPGWASHVELAWKVPSGARLLRGLAEFSRLIRFDKRGTGMSDRLTESMTFEQRMDDIRAVMDAVGSERAALMGISEGASMSILFAATYPQRATALVLCGGQAKTMSAPDYPLGSSVEGEREAAEDEANWGKPGWLEALASGALVEADQDEAGAWADVFRYSVSPGAVAELDRLNAAIDVRPALPTIRIPTLVVHQTDDPWVVIGHGRYLAEHIAGARFVELPGAAHALASTNLDVFLRDVRAFLESAWDGGWTEPEPDRVLATVLFTDLVGSTARAAELGDRAWRKLLEQHHARIRQQLVHFRGHEHDTAGDGFFASFDGPARAIRCACAIRDSLGELDLDVRAGLHTGECELLDNKVAGIAVAIGARVAAQASPGEVLVSGTVKDLVAGSGIEFTDRGTAELKGVPGDWRLYAVAVA